MGRRLLLGTLLAATLLPASAQAATTNVGLADKTFTPAGVSIARGDTITWVWNETDTHHIVADVPTPGWDSGELTALGSTFSRTFSQAGVFPYHCVIHADDGMRGTITVPNATPSVLLESSTMTPASGASVTFTATAADGDGTITNYSWDLDGNGSYETDGGTSPTRARSFTGPASPTVGVRVTDSDGANAADAVALTVAAPPAQDPPPVQQDPPPTQPTPPPATSDPAPVIAQPATVPAALAPSTTSTATTKPAGPSFSAPTGQKLKLQKGVKISASCPGGCTLVFTGTVTVGGKKLKLTKLTKSLGAGKSSVFTVKVADAKALRRAKGKAKASIKVASTSGGQSATKTITVNLKS